MTGHRSVVRAADLDQDGYLDLFVGGHTTSPYYGDIPQSYLLHNDGNGHFSILDDQAAPGLGRVGMVTGACWTDINKDGRPDLVVVGEWMAPVIYVNQGGGRLRRQASPLDKLTGWWNCVEAVDVNQDGYPDLVLGNWGTNSKITASTEYPLKMWVGDFEKNGRQEQLLCVAKEGKYYPFRGKEDLESVMPSLKKRFLEYGSMAGQTVEAIFGDKLNLATLFEATTMESMLLVNDQAGGFSPRPLPIEMQWAPVFSFYSGDFDQDGKPDLLAGGNFYGVIPFEGRYDAMPPTVAWGDGKGGFRTTLPYAQALLISGEVRDIKPLHVRGSNQTRLILARSNDSLTFIGY
jgi:hypothetical protein